MICVYLWIYCLNNDMCLFVNFLILWCVYLWIFCLINYIVYLIWFLRNEFFFLIYGWFVDFDIFWEMNIVKFLIWVNKLYRKNCFYFFLKFNLYIFRGWMIFI